MPWSTDRNDALRDLIRNSGFTQRSLADALGVHESHVSRVIRRGYKLSLEEMGDWARILGVDIDALLLED